MNRTPKEISNALKLVYTDNLIKYRITHMRQHPALLLSILLLSNIDTYKEVTTNIQEFYEVNRKNILEQINKVIKDFNFDEFSLLLYTKNVCIKDEEFLLIQVFSSAINALYYACNNKDNNLINIINSFSINWGGEHILEEYLACDLSQDKTNNTTIKRYRKGIKRIKTTTTGFRCKP